MSPLFFTTSAAVVALLLFKTHRPHTLPIDNTKKPSALLMWILWCLMHTEMSQRLRLHKHFTFTDFSANQLDFLFSNPKKKWFTCTEKKDAWQRKDLYINGNFFSLFFQIRNHCMKFVCQLVMIGKMDMIYSLANNSTWQETGWWYSGVRSHLQLSYYNLNQLCLIPNLLVYVIFFQSCFWN